MGTLEFIHGIVDSLAWPLTTIAVITLLRKQIGLLLSRIKRIKHKDSEIEIEQGIANAAKQADENNLPQVNPSSENDRIYRLAADSPRGAILDSWLEVEEAIKSYCERNGIIDNARSPLQLIQSMHMRNLDYNTIGQGVFDMLEKLRKLRNEAVHVSDSEISSKTAIEYSSLAKRVIARIEEA